VLESPVKFRAVSEKEYGPNRPEIHGTVDFGFNMFIKKNMAFGRAYWYISIGRRRRTHLLDFTCKNY
jgi:hypothetical protein